MSKVVSTINLKGGVGKTSTTVAIAEFLAYEHNKKVLLIDLDPQTNATVALMGENAWLDKNNKGETLLQLFKDKLDNTEEFNLEKAIQKNVSNIDNGIQGLDLLPSSLGLIDIQDSLPLIPSGKFHVTSPVTIIKDVVENKLDDYDYVLIDCPPNLGIITLNGILISDYYVIPCIPDVMSTYGIPQILNRINDFNHETGQNVDPLGIIISLYRAQSSLHDNTIRQIKQKSETGQYPPLFNTRISLNVRSAEAADFNAPVNTIKQKYGYGGYYEDYNQLTNEFLSYIEQ